MTQGKEALPDVITAPLRITPEDRAALDYLETMDDLLVARAIQWCALNSGSRNLVGLAEQAELLAGAMSCLPGTVEFLELASTMEVNAQGGLNTQANAVALRLQVRPEAPVQVALTGHYDTVYPADTAFRSVIHAADGSLNGPGIADMKGGISVMLGAIEAFERHPLARNLGYTVLLSPDEETGSLASAPLLSELGARAHVGMTYEPALSDGTLVSARKGSGNYHVVLRGRAAHAGRDFAKGRNAVVAAARLAAMLDALNGERDGFTLNIARIDGGGPLNMVPDIAIVRFNIRVTDQAEAVWFEARLAGLLAASQLEGIEIKLSGGINRPAKPFGAAQQALFNAVGQVGALIGQPLAWQPSGGVCEGNNLFAAGLPGIDTLGVRGGNIHSPREYAWPESFGERSRLSTLLLCKLADGSIDAAGLKRAVGRERGA